MESEIYYNGLCNLGNVIKLQHWFYHVDYDITQSDAVWEHYQNNIYSVPVSSVLDITEIANVYNVFEPFLLNANIRKMESGGYTTINSSNYMLYLFFGSVFNETTFVIINDRIAAIEPNTLYFLNTKQRTTIHTFVDNVYYLELELVVNNASYENLINLLNIN